MIIDRKSKYKQELFIYTLYVIKKGFLRSVH